MVSVGLSRSREQDLIWVEAPFDQPAANLVVGAARADAFGILDLGGDADRAREALTVVTRRTATAFGVRVSTRCPLGPSVLPDAVHTVVVADAALVARWRGGARRAVAEVRSLDEARVALASGVDRLVARGAESGGRVGTTGAFVLLQQVRAATDLPVWLQGGHRPPHGGGRHRGRPPRRPRGRGRTARPAARGAERLTGLRP